ncbi:MAG: hypothetical protein ACR2J7_04910 [Luteimonas sp.]
MNTKTTVLFALLMPGLVALAGCNRGDNNVDDAAMPPADTMATDSASAMDTMPADGMMDGRMMGHEMTFAHMDKNSDGSVSMDELAPTDMLHQHFSVADTDGNGMLSEAEITQHHADMAMDQPR